jgi:protein phosphatase PTC2/3
LAPSKPEKGIIESCGNDYVPVVRSGACADMGIRRSMEDVYFCCDDFSKHYGLKNFEEEPSAFYGVCAV